jgi:hypothetical protein
MLHHHEERLRPKGDGADDRRSSCRSTSQQLLTKAMQLHLNEIATKVSPGAHAIVLLDQADWHKAKPLKVPDAGRYVASYSETSLLLKKKSSFNVRRCVTPSSSNSNVS